MVIGDYKLELALLGVRRSRACPFFCVFRARVRMPLTPLRSSIHRAAAHSACISTSLTVRLHVSHVWQVGRCRERRCRARQRPPSGPTTASVHGRLQPDDALWPAVSSACRSAGEPAGCHASWVGRGAGWSCPSAPVGAWDGVRAVGEVSKRARTLCLCGMYCLSEVHRPCPCFYNTSCAHVMIVQPRSTPNAHNQLHRGSRSRAEYPSWAAWQSTTTRCRAASSRWRATARLTAVDEPHR